MVAEVATGAVMHETQATITAWANETFGEIPTSATLVARANEEMAELLRAVTQDDHHPKLSEELADVVIVLCRLGDRFGVDVLGQEKPFTRENWGPYWLVFNATQSYYKSNAGRVADVGVRLMELLGDVALGWSHYTQSYSLVRVCILLHWLAREFGCDLQAEVEKKMAVNRTRVWAKTGDGHGYHVRQK